MYSDEELSVPLSLSSDGDQIFIFQGAANNPTMLFGINFNAPGWAGSANSGTNSALPPTLDSSTSLNAVELIDGISIEYNNGIYKGTTTGTPENLLAEIVKVSNWELSDGSLENALPLSFNISPTGIRNLNLYGESKSANGFVVYLAFPIMAILLFSFIRLRQYKLIKHN